MREPIRQGIQFRSAFKVIQKICRNNLCQNIYRCIPSGSTLHYTLIHTPTILHKKTFFATACHLRKKIFYEKKCHIVPCYTRAHFTRHCPLLNTTQNIYSINQDHFPLARNINKSIQPKQVNLNIKIESKHFSFSFFEIRVSVRFQSAIRPQQIYITSRDYASCLFILFICSSQVLRHQQRQSIVREYMFFAIITTLNKTDQCQVILSSIFNARFL